MQFAFKNFAHSRYGETRVRAVHSQCRHTLFGARQHHTSYTATWHRNIYNPRFAKL
jgi:hypothetical protein